MSCQPPATGDSGSLFRNVTLVEDFLTRLGRRYIALDLHVASMQDTLEVVVTELDQLYTAVKEFAAMVHEGATEK